MTDFNAATGLAKGSFGIGTFSNGGKPFAAVIKDDGVAIDLSAHYADTHAIFDDWDRAFDKLAALASKTQETGLAFDKLKALPPLAHPNMLCAGANYRVHVAEMMTHNKFNQHYRKPGESDEDFFQRNLEDIDKRAKTGMPFFWTGLHSALVGANDDVILPAVGESHDWELEFGCVIGRGGRYLKPTETDDIIAGYVMVNDLGTVTEFRRSDVRWGYDWVSKHQPSFKPAGPFIVPKHFVKREETRIKLKVNGAVKQDWPVTDMIFTEQQILSYASERIRLMPGDMLITGSPPGNGAMHGHFLNPGDVIDSEITFLGRQRNNVRAEEMNGRTSTYGLFPVD